MSFLILHLVNQRWLNSLLSIVFLISLLGFNGRLRVSFLIMQSNTRGSIACKTPIKAMFHYKAQCCAESWASRRNEYIALEGTARLLIQCISFYTSLCLSNLCFSAQKEKWKDCGRGMNAVLVFLSLFCFCVVFSLIVFELSRNIVLFPPPLFIAPVLGRDVLLCPGDCERSIVLNYVSSVQGAESPVWSL